MTLRDAPAEPAAAATVSGLELIEAWRRAAEDWVKWWSRTAFPAAPSYDGSRSAAHLLVAPERHAAITADYQRKLAALWRAAMSTPPGEPLREFAAPAAEDRRFRAKAWRTSPFHAFVMQAYLLHRAYLSDLVDNVSLPAADHQRLRFIVRQYLDALAPTNFPATNPEALKRALATQGASFVAGASQLAGDIERGRISMSDPSAFEVGRNLAVTPGSVVFRNELIELIQYAPSTSTVYERPLVIVPPCINKFYILDLSPSNSLVRHAVGEGHTTFIVSWRNIPRELGHLGWDDYLAQGVLEAIRVAREITGSSQVNTLGFCVGGTLLACALAVLAARKDASVASVTLLTTMLDFADPGEIGVYVTREFLAAREPALRAGARLPGSELATAFATLRANDLVWNYVVNNYLMGEPPPAFDLLHWNGDSANLPGPMYAYYLRNMYLDNQLRIAGALTMLGERIDLGRIRVPAYVLATRDDHIVPWQSAYRTLGLLGGESTFTLGASGHIAGVVNPPLPPKRSHWTRGGATDDPERWLEHAQAVPGSWWPEWAGWLAKHALARRAAPSRTGSATYPPLDPAPGRYVTEAVR